MKKTENKFNFDLSNLNLKELIGVYDNIDEFLHFLEEQKIVTKSKEEDENA